MDNTLMKVTQLPVIEEHLRSRKEQTEQRVAEAMSLACTDETLTSVKNIRAEMNREFADAETQRKAIKAAIMEKYDSFESVYRECIADPYKRADYVFHDVFDKFIEVRLAPRLLGDVFKRFFTVRGERYAGVFGRHVFVVRQIFKRAKKRRKGFQKRVLFGITLP